MSWFIQGESKKVPYTITIEYNYLKMFKEYCKANSINASSLMNRFVIDYCKKNIIKK